jgi:molybdate-binding protein
MKVFLKILGIVVITIIILFYIASNHSYTEKKYRGSSANGFAKEIFVKHTKYASWVFWGDSDGTLFIEVPNHFSLNYYKLKEGNYLIEIYDDDILVGTFSKLSSVLNIRLTPTKVSFNGELIPIIG